MRNVSAYKEPGRMVWVPGPIGSIVEGRVKLQRLEAAVLGVDSVPTSDKAARDAVRNHIQQKFE